MESFIWFDLGFTLVHFGREQRNTIQHPTDALMVAVGGWAGEDKAYIDQAIFANSDITGPEELASHLALRFTATARLDSISHTFWAHQLASPVAYTNAFSLLATLFLQGRPYGIISNCTLPMWEGVHRIFGHLVEVPRLLSCSEEVQKPSSIIFDSAEAMVASGVQNIMVGDDFINDIVPARRKGWDTIFIQKQAGDRVRHLGGQIFPKDVHLIDCLVAQDLAQVGYLLDNLTG